MIKTFIFGTPHGFDFYEKDPLYNKYFQGFYISNRKGRRLMVNRRDNGETIYSYIHYGFKEIIDRPARGLFGMSLILDNDTYCSDFNKIFEWFEYLFGIIEKEKNIFKTNESGVYQYTVDKFSDNTTDVEWLKSVMPNIFSNPSAGTSLIKYDSSFSSKKTGKIIQFNNSEDQSKILKGFRQCRWLSISPEVAVEPELDYFELLECYNEFNEIIVQIAINTTQNDKDLLSDIQKDCEEHQQSVINYINSIVNYDQKHVDSFKELAEKFQSLHANVGTLLSKLESKVVILPTQMRICSECGRNLPESHFADESKGICRDCERQSKTKPSLRMCKKCGENKPLNNFHEGKDICIKCEEQSAQKTIELNKMFGSLLGKDSVKTISIIALFIAVSIISIISIKKCSSEEPDASDRTLTIADSENTGSVDKKVDETELKMLLDDENFAGALSYIKTCTNGNYYVNNIKEAIQSSIKNIFQTQPKGKIEELVNQFIIVNKAAMFDIGYTDKDIEYIKKYATDYVTIQTIIQKEVLTESDYGQALRIAEKYNLKEEAALLKGRWKSQQEARLTQKIIIQLFGVDKKTAIGDPYIVINDPMGYKAGTVGQYIRIDCNSVKASNQCPFENNPKKKEYWIRLTKVGKAVYTCDGKQVTIEAKEASPQTGTQSETKSPTPKRH